jgi:hypothetical protein
VVLVRILGRAGWGVGTVGTAKYSRNVAFLCTAGNRGSLNVTITQIGDRPGGNAATKSDLFHLEPGPEVRPTPSPLSDTTTLQSDNVDGLAGTSRGLRKRVE